MAESAPKSKGETSKAPPLTVDTVMRAVHGVRDWRRFGWLLFLWSDISDEDSKLDTIEQQHNSDGNYLHGVVKEWFSGHQQSWRHVIFALDRVDERALADSIRGYAEPPPDTTLTLDRVAAVMDEIKDLEEVRGWLGVPDHVVDHLSEREKKHAVGNYYLQTHPRASWENLTLMLYYVEEFNAVEKTKQHLPKADPTLTTSNVLTVLSGLEERWEELGEKLHVRQSKRNKIRHHRGSTHQIEALFNFYIRYHYAPSWQRIASALQEMGLHDLADVVTTKYVRGISSPRPAGISPTPGFEAGDSLGAKERKYLAACERAMKEKGSVEQITMHCVFLGLPQSGKSSVIKCLLGKRLSVSTSTGVAEKVVKVELRKTTAQVSGLLWCELEDLDDEAVLVMCNVSRTAPADVASLTTGDPVRSQPGKAFSFSQFFRKLFTRGHCSEQHEAALSSPSLVEPPSPGEQGMKSPLDVFRDAFRKKPSKLKELVDEPWMLYITDTGGQPEFQELLPILVSGPSLFFLVFSLHLELNKRFQVEYITSQGKATVPYEAGLTVQEMLLQSLATIASTSVFRMVGSKKVIIQPNIFFVATHKDLVSKEHIHQMDIALQEVVKRTEAYKDGMVQFGSESQMIIAVNNLSEGEEDVQQIRAAVERIGKRGDDYRVKTPFSWLIFSNIMQQMKSPVLKYEQCFSVAQQCGIDTRQEMNDALRFLHENVGVVRYYHDVSELQGFIIKDPQYVFDVITDLIVSTFTFDHADPVVHEQFTKKGIFPLDVFEKLAGSTEFLPPSKLVTLLQHLNIVAVLNKDSASPHYFMPCALAHSESSKSIESSSTSHIPSLLVAFKSGYCPKGLFGALVVYLLQNKMKSKLEWVLEQDKIYRDQICLSVGPYDSFQLKVLPAYLSIELYFCPGVSVRRLSLASVCSEVRCSISKAIGEVSETLHCSRKAAFSFGFLCPEKVDTDHSSHPAIINVLDGQPCNLTCPLTHKRFDLPNDSQVWFNEVGPAQNSRAAACVENFIGCYPTLGMSLDLSGMNLTDHPEPEESYLSEEDLTDITEYLLPMEKTHTYNLRLVLGISQHKTKAMMDSSTFLDDVIAAWLRREDQVKKKGEPSWTVLVRALEHPRVGQCGISENIRKDKGLH